MVYVKKSLIHLYLKYLGHLWAAAPIDTCMYWISCRNGCNGLLVLYLLLLLKALPIVEIRLVRVCCIGITVEDIYGNWVKWFLLVPILLSILFNIQHSIFACRIFVFDFYCNLLEV